MGGKSQAVDNCLGLGCAASHSHVHMDVFAERTGDGVAALEHVAGLGAGAHGHNAAGFGNLRNASEHAGQSLLGDRAGDNNDVGLSGSTGELEAQTLGVIAGSDDRDQLYIAAIAGTGIDVEQLG